jgi:hypothetical protein
MFWRGTRLPPAASPTESPKKGIVEANLSDFDCNLLSNSLDISLGKIEWTARVSRSPAMASAFASPNQVLPCAIHEIPAPMS